MLGERRKKVTFLIFLDDLINNCTILRLCVLCGEIFTINK